MWVILLHQGLMAQNTNFVTLDPIYSHQEIKALKMQFMYHGDDWSYKEYMNNNFDYDQFAYALLMANKYNNLRSCYYVYWCLIEDLYEKYGVDVDSATYNFVLPYLEKGASLGEANCKYKLPYFTGTKKLNKIDSLFKERHRQDIGNRARYKHNTDDPLLFIKTGNVEAFTDYLSKTNGIASLPVCVLMANQYNNEYACYLVYTIITKELFANNNIEIDSTNLNIAISFLKRGAMNGSQECLSELSVLYKNGIYFPVDLREAEEYEYKLLNTKQN